MMVKLLKNKIKNSSKILGGLVPLNNNQPLRHNFKAILNLIIILMPLPKQQFLNNNNNH
jgi:hypothetical protein